MKLATTIAARKDGTVIVRGLDGEKYTFTHDDACDDLTAEVPHDETASFLLAGGMFYPCDPQDYEQALEMAQPKEGEGDGQPPQPERKRKAKKD